MKIIFNVFMICSSFNLSAKDDAIGILKESYKAIKSHRSISYISTFYFKGFQRTDTLVYRANVCLLRVPADSGFGGMIWLDHENKYTFYNLKKVYNVDKYGMTARVVHQSADIAPNISGPMQITVKGNFHPKAVPYSLAAGEFYGACVWDEFLRPKLFKKNIDAETLKRLNDTTIDGKDCYEIFIQHNANGQLDYYWASILYINKNDLMVVMERYWSKNGEDTECTLRIFENYVFDKVEKSRFSKKQIPDFYTIKE